MVSVCTDCTKILTHLIHTVAGFGSDSTHPVNICFIENQNSTIDDFESLELMISTLYPTTKRMTPMVRLQLNASHLVIVATLGIYYAMSN